MGYQFSTNEAREKRRKAGRELQQKYNQMSGKGLKIWKERDPEALSRHAREQCKKNKEKGPAALAKYRAEHMEEFREAGRKHAADPAFRESVRNAAIRFARNNPDEMKRRAAKGHETIKRAKQATKELEELGIDYQVYGKGKEAIDRAERFIKAVKSKVK